MSVADPHFLFRESILFHSYWMLLRTTSIGRSHFVGQKYGVAQWISPLPTPPPTSEADRLCIYHKAPTFGGLSGAPIIGSDFDATGTPLRRFVVGLHLRSGTPEDPYQLNADCGSYPDFNIGLALPAEVLKHVDAAGAEISKQ
jgi:hypothetical protein